MRDKILGFGIEIFDIIVYLVLWASLWSIYDYLIEKYVGKLYDMRTFIINMVIFILGVIVLLVRNILIYKYNPF